MLERQRMLRREPDGTRYVAGPWLSARVHLPALRRAAAALAATGADD
jgi:hypothetical protein